MLIIIEGVNGSGKSTLSKILSKEFGLPILHAGPKPKNDNVAISQCFEQSKIRYAIMDRVTCISRQIYGDNNERIEGLSEDHILTLNNYIAHHIIRNDYFIHTTGDGPHQLKDYYTDKHIEEITKNRCTLKERYVKVFETIPHTEFNFEVDSIEELIQKIKNWKDNYALTRNRTEIS